MSPAQAQDAAVPPVEAELNTMSSSWWWFLLLGVLMLILGFAAVGCGITTFFVTVLTVKVFGFLLLFGGVAQVISSFWSGKWSGFLLHLLVGVFYVVVGFIIIDNTEASLAAITLLIAAFLIVGGIFRIVSALTMRFHDWGWVLLNGIIAVLLGLMIHEGWPASSLFVIGLFIGIELLFNGITWIIMGLELRKLSKAV